MRIFSCTRAWLLCVEPALGVRCAFHSLHRPSSVLGAPLSFRNVYLLCVPPLPSPLPSKYVNTEDDVIALLKLGESARTVAFTEMNSVSSRSHRSHTPRLPIPHHGSGAPRACNARSSTRPTRQ